MDRRLSLFVFTAQTSRKVTPRVGILIIIRLGGASEHSPSNHIISTAISLHTSIVRLSPECHFNGGSKYSMVLLYVMPLVKDSSSRLPHLPWVDVNVPQVWRQVVDIIIVRLEPTTKQKRHGRPGEQRECVGGQHPSQHPTGLYGNLAAFSRNGTNIGWADTRKRVSQVIRVLLRAQMNE